MDNKRRAQKRERAAATELGGRAHPGSGSVWYKKCDFSSEAYICEDKFTDANFYSIKYSVLKVLHGHATKVGKVPIFRFGFDKYQQNYILVSVNDYNDYVQSSYYKLDTDKQSLRMDMTGLSHLCAQATSIILAEITFTLYNKRYLLLTWDDFLENQTKFSAI